MTQIVPGSVSTLVHQEGGFKPYISSGFVSVNGQNPVPVRILRDTGAAQSFLLEGVLPLSKLCATDSSVLIRGIEIGFITVPLHKIHLVSDLVSDTGVVGVRPVLPIADV